MPPLGNNVAALAVISIVPFLNRPLYTMRAIISFIFELTQECAHKHAHQSASINKQMSLRINVCLWIRTLCARRGGWVDGLAAQIDTLSCEYVIYIYVITRIFQETIQTYSDNAACFVCQWMMNDALALCVKHSNLIRFPYRTATLSISIVCEIRPWAVVIDDFINIATRSQ